MRASYGYRKAYDPDARHFANALGGGAILDVGCYCTSMSRLVAGIAAGAHCADPVDVQGAANLVDTGVDENAVATLRFADGMLAQLACSITAVPDNKVRIFGTEGWIEVPSPWFRSEEHTSELQSLMRISYAVFCLKKKTKQHKITNEHTTTRTTM